MYCVCGDCVFRRTALHGRSIPVGLTTDLVQEATVAGRTASHQIGTQRFQRLSIMGLSVCVCHAPAIESIVKKSPHRKKMRLVCHVAPGAGRCAGSRRPDHARGSSFARCIAMPCPCAPTSRDPFVCRCTMTCTTKRPCLSVAAHKFQHRRKRGRS